MMLRRAFLRLLPILLIASCKAIYNSLKHKLALEVFVQNNKNFVISPFMVRFPLCKLASVAKGSARNDLLSVLGMRPEKIRTCYTDLDRGVTGLKNMDYQNLNKIILNYTDDVRSEFISNSSNYGVRVDKVGYNYPNLAVTFVNRWVDTATYKRIPDVLELGDINNKTSIIIINAAYLKVTWEFPFDIRKTKTLRFHHLNGRVSDVPMMSKTETCLYLNDDISRTQYITMKLASFGLTMSVMLPQTIKGLPELLRKLLNEPEYLNGVRKRMKYEMIKITLPRFKIKKGLELNEYLRKIGASLIFNETYSGLNGILKNSSAVKNIYVSKVKQKNFIDVDEMGIFRQLPREGYDAMIGRGSVANEVVFNHPFYFTINIQTNLYNNDHMYNMFQGVYYGPEE